MAALDIRDRTTPWWKVPYAIQLANKQKKVETLLCDLVGDKEIKDILPSPVIEGYRNKNEFTIGINMQGKVEVGFNSGRYSDGLTSVESVSECLQVPWQHKAVATQLRDFLRSSPLPTYDKGTKEGLWRRLIARSNADGELILLIQAKEAGSSLHAIAQEKQRLRTELPKWPIGKSIAGLLWQQFNGMGNVPNSNTVNGITPNSAGSDFDILLGKHWIHQHILGVTFPLRIDAFSQINSSACQTLYKVVHGLVSRPLPFIPGGKISSWHMVDLFCGIGSIALTTASTFLKSPEQKSSQDSTQWPDSASQAHPCTIIGIDSCSEAIIDAKKAAASAEFSGEYVQFICAAVEYPGLLPKLLNILQHLSMDNKIKAAVDSAGFLNQNSFEHLLDGHFPCVNENGKAGNSNICVVVNPPRCGLHKRVVDALRECCAVCRVVYVCCNQVTMHRDVLRLVSTTPRGKALKKNKKATQKTDASSSSRAFQVSCVQPVDMFPHTKWCEVVVLLERLPLPYPNAGTT